MLRRSLIAVVGAAALAAPAAAAPVRGQTLMPGVVYSRQVQFTAHGPVVLNVVSSPRPTGLYALHAALSNGAVQGLEPLTQMESELSRTTTAVGVNGDLFDSRWGTPSSVFVRDGLVLTGSKGGRSAAGFDAAGRLHVDRPTLSGTWKGTGQNRPLGLNEPPGRSAVTLYTPAWGATTPAETGTLEVVLAPFPATAPNTVLTAPIAQIVQGGNQAIPANGAVLVARGNQVPVMTSEAPAGATVSVRLILTPRWGDVRDAVGGGPALVRGGKPVFRPNEAFTTPQLFTRSARSAVGVTADGRILFVTADGGRAGYSLGVANFELALALMRLGAVDACALGTGASAALAFDGKLLSRPSGDPSVADALFVTYDGVYAPTPTPSGASATLAYKLVRRSNVTATLTAPDGSVSTLDAATHDAGTYTFDRASLGAGKWTFAVTATDDLGRRSAVDRTFTVGS
jgi:Phosphodiester glycosidase